jgi:uncharacterized protein YgiM (DUF1202 family)
MKTNFWLVMGAMVASSAIAQDNTNVLPDIPAPVTTPAAEAASAPMENPAATTTPAKPKPRAAAPKRAPLHEPTVTLAPGPAEVTVSNLIVRGQAGFDGEIVTHVFKGDTVTVLDQVNLAKHEVGEPAQWAKIALPANVHVWVFSRYIDNATKEVTARRLNLRAGPGENYSVLGVIEKGTPVTEIETEGNWIQIKAPETAYAFVAAMYLKQEAPAPMVATTATMVNQAAPVPAPAPIPAPAPEPTPVPEPQPIVTTPTPAPAPPPVETTTPPAEPEVAATPTPTATVESNVPPPPRVVSHEGVVRHVGSLVAPTEYELYDPSTGKSVDYLYPSLGNLNLGKYVNARVVVTGEEALDKRWKDIPILTVEQITVIEANAVSRTIYRTPRQAQNH